MTTVTTRQSNMWANPVQVKRGDIFTLGKHRLMCGDSTDAEDVARLFDGERFALCFTSPPYSDQRDYKLGSFNWHDMMCGSFDQMIVQGKPDCHILINLGLSHKNRQVDMYWLQWLLYCASVQWPVFGWYVWDKGPGLPGNFDGRLAPAHEFIFHFNNKNNKPCKWVATKARPFRVDIGLRYKDGGIKKEMSPDKFCQDYKIPDSVIRINRECARGIHTANHPAVFPVALPEFIMKTWSQPDDIVYEPFAGSGTSIIAAENLRRRCYAMEIEPTYCQLAIQRWQEHTGQQARLEVHP
jgi:DNA modification methylase